MPGVGSTVMGSGTDHMVVVGGSAGLVFTPPVVEAQVNDTVTFVFQSKNHTVTQSAFATPCNYLQDMTNNQMGFRSGYVQVSGDAAPDTMPRWTLRIEASTPLWFYCEQSSHCGKKMVGAINPAKAGDKTFEAFQRLAEQQSTMATPGAAPPSPDATAPPAPTGPEAPLSATTPTGAATSAPLPASAAAPPATPVAAALSPTQPADVAAPISPAASNGVTSTSAESTAPLSPMNLAASSTSESSSPGVKVDQSVSNPRATSGESRLNFSTQSGVQMCFLALILQIYILIG
ncbi:hypothetical protein BY996DRAFT_4587264 [Phakopsora pachyrhizi]|uniref:Expressed protein n=1 Tax=Phakopsora pachyrhizi TaxID=170000 RepID=A0AAV0ATU2_PHAPC|nr:hypothetical protein BY996DRAFT_4587264 [Phakopsora pachyrhizi]CAH7672202.1 expressed protein [Phakopsora pachyrhizi]